jgi:hypothetical protein
MKEIKINRGGCLKLSRKKLNLEQKKILNKTLSELGISNNKTECKLVKFLLEEEPYKGTRTLALNLTLAHFQVRNNFPKNMKGFYSILKKKEVEAKDAQVLV